MKLRYFFIILIVGSLMLLSIAGGGFYWILAQSPWSILRGGITTYPQAAIFVPKNAPAMVSLGINPDRLEAWRLLATPIGDRQKSRRELNEIGQNLLATTGLDYQEDIQPWLGDEVTLAITSLDFDRTSNNGIQPGYLLAASTKKPKLAREFLQLSLSKGAIEGTSDLVFEEYQGVKLIYKRPVNKKTGATLASAVVGDFVLFANYPKVLREAINNVQAVDRNLQTNPSYQKALATIREPRIAIAYANLPALSAWLGKTDTPETPEVEQTLTAALSAKSGGLKTQTALIGIQEGDRAPLLTDSVKAFNYLPKQTIFTASGVNLKEFWQEVTTSLEPNSPVAQIVIQTIAAIENPLDIHLAEDIFSWVKGEYALALLSNLDNQELDWLFIAEKTPEVNLDEAIEHLDSLAKERGLSVATFPLKNANVTAWTKLNTAAKDSTVKLEAQVQGAHTTVNNYEIFGTSPEAISRALNAKEEPLLATKGFKKAIASLPKENDGYLYVDWDKGRSVFESKAPVVRVLELSAQPLFDHLRSLTLSSQGQENGVRRATVFFNL
jgi:Protein of unknown function (DUF3352)